MRNNLPINSKKKFKFSITFQSFDEESLDAGDSLDNGYEKEDDIDTIGDILYEANTTYGIYMPVSFGTWESTEPEEDKDFFEKGIRKYYALHITNEDGTEISQEESDFIAFLLSDGRYEINKFRDYAVGGIVLGAVALGVGALITYFYFKGKKPKKAVANNRAKSVTQIIKDKKPKKAVANNRAKSVTHIINGKERTYPIKDAWRREHKLQNKSEKYEVPQEDRKPVNFEMGGDASEYYHEVEYGEGGVARAKDVIMNKIGYNEETADYFVSQSEKFAIWLADSILKEEIKNKNYNKKQWLDTPLSSYRVINANYGGGIRTILDWLQHPVTPKQDLRKLSFDEAVEKAQDWHNELQVLGGDIDFIEPESNVIIKRYPKTDEGIEYYWIYIPSNYCDLESSRMGHCGRTGYGNKLISLRSVKPFGKGHTISDSHVTIAYGVNDGLFYQIKGKKNNKPSEKYFSYVFDLIKSILNDDINERFRKENQESIKVVEYLMNEQKKIEQEILPLLTFPYFSSASSTEIRFLEGNLSLDESKKYLRQDSPIYDNSGTIYKLKEKLNEVRNNRDYEEIQNEIERLREETKTYLKENIFDKYKELSRLGSLKKESEKGLMYFEFNGFGSEYGDSEDYGFEDMTNEEIRELYELKPSVFTDAESVLAIYDAGVITDLEFQNEYEPNSPNSIFSSFGNQMKLYERGIILNQPSTIVEINYGCDDVARLLNIDRGFSDDLVSQILCGDIGELYDGWSYYYDNPSDLVSNLNKENEQRVIDEIVRITKLEESVVKENGIEYYLNGDDDDFSKDDFDNIIRTLASAQNSADNSDYYKYLYDAMESALNELGEVKSINYEGVEMTIDLSNSMSLEEIGQKMDYYEFSDVEDLFNEKLGEDIERPNLRIDDRYSPYGSDEDFNSYVADTDLESGYEKGGSLRPKTINTNKKTKIKNMKPSQRKLAKGGNIETGISKEDYFLVIKNWVYFTFNYPMGFVKDAFNSKHLEEKFSSSYERYGSLGVLMSFWANLDSNNREILSMWIKNNYFSSSDDKSKLLTISDYDYAKIISHWNMFCFNFPYRFIEKVFVYNTSHFEMKWSRAYESAGSTGAVNKLFTELDGGNQRKFINWVYDNYKGMTFAGGGGVGENEIDFQNFTIDEFKLFVKSINAYGDIQVSVSVGNNVNKEGTYTKKIELKKIKDLSMSIGYGKEISVYKGSETIYADVLVYDNNYDNGYREYTISLFSKDDQTGLKSVVNSIIEKFKNGGRVTTNDGIIEAFLTTNKQLKVGNLSTHFNQYDNQILLRNYGTLIATRKDNDVEITNTKFSKTTTTITNKVKTMALNSRMNVKHVDKFVEGGEAGELINVSGYAFYITDTSVENADKDFDLLSDTFFSSKDDFENNMDAIQEFSFNVNVKYQYNIIPAIYEQMAEEGVGNDEGAIQILGFEVDRYPKNDFESELPYDIEDEDEEDDDDDEYAKGGGVNDKDLQVIIKETPIIVGVKSNGYEDIIFVGEEFKGDINKLGYSDVKKYKSLKDYFVSTNNDIAVFKSEDDNISTWHEDYILGENESDFVDELEQIKEGYYDGTDMTTFQSLLDKYNVTNWDGYVFDDVSNNYIVSRVNKLKEPYLTKLMLRILSDNRVIKNGKIVVKNVKDEYANGGEADGKIKIRGFAPINKEVAISMNDDFKQNFKSNLEKYTKHLNYVHNSKLRLIDVKEVIDFANKYAGGGEAGNWVNYDKNHLINTETGMIVSKGTNLKDIKPKDIKGFEKLGMGKYAEGGEAGIYNDEESLFKDAFVYFKNKLGVELSINDFIKTDSYETSDYYVLKETPQNKYKLKRILELINRDSSYDKWNSLQIITHNNYLFGQSKFGLSFYTAVFKNGRISTTQSFMYFPEYKNKYGEIKGGLKYAEGGEAGSFSYDYYAGKKDEIITKLKSMKGGLDNKAPYVFLKDGFIYVSAEYGDNYADYYELLYIDEKLEELADEYDTYWEWEDAGSIFLAQIDTYAEGGEAGTLFDEGLFTESSTYADGGEIRTEIDENGSNIPDDLNDIFAQMDLDREGDYEEMERLRGIANEIGYDFDYGLDGNPTEFWKIETYADGGGVTSMSDEEIADEYDKILSVQILAGDIDEDEVEELSISEKREFLENYNDEYAKGGGVRSEIIIKSGNNGNLKVIYHAIKNQKTELTSNEIFDQEKMKGKSVFLFVNDELYAEFIADGDIDEYAKGGEAGEWSVTDITDAEYLGIIEFEDYEGEFHNFEIMETDDRLVFGGMTNSGFIESGYIEKDGFSTDETLQSLLEDLEVYYNDGAEYTSQIVFNKRMAKGGSTYADGGGVTSMSDEEIADEYDKILSVQILAGDIDEDEVEELSISEKREFLENYNDEYADGGEVQDWMEQALDSLIKETGNDDLEITIVSDNGNEFFAGNDMEEYRVFKTEEDAEEKAIEQVSDDMQEFPENFNQDWLMNYIDGRDFFEQALNEMNESDVDDIQSESDRKYANRLIAELVDNGLMDEEDAESDNAEELADDLKSDYVTLLTEGQLGEGNNGLDYFIGNFGENETYGMVVDNNLIDIDEASQNAVDTDGIGHFLSSYDGETLYLSDDCVAYRVN